MMSDRFWVKSVVRLFPLFTVACLQVSCANDRDQQERPDDAGKAATCMQVPTRFVSRQEMILIPGGTYQMGGNGDQATPDEFPVHTVRVDSFYIDAHEVTNAQFRQFVEATGYVTTAEKKPDWEELKKMLPPDAPTPDDSMLVAASLVFVSTPGPVDLNDYNAWWKWEKGADWRHPQGAGSSINGKDNYPVVQVSWDDAMAYCQWAGKRLPTEAEWEYAARGGLSKKIYPWGDEGIHKGTAKANSWEGEFPYLNTQKDKYVRCAPVKSYAPNGFGLSDMAGNVWEWCSDWYAANYYQQLEGSVADNPKGPKMSFDPQEPYTPKKVVRGGSFLCNDAYCSGYRVSRRMRTSPDTGLEHTGFRCVADIRR